MGKRANKSRDGVDCLPDAQKELLLYILLNGPSPVYGTHKILKRSQSTVQTSMKELEKEGLVYFVRDEPSEKNRTKNLYGLTLGGFCYGFCVLARSKTTTYPLIEGVIGRWQHLCPEILGNWDYLTKEKQDECPFPVDLENVVSKSPDFQLPYEVPNTKAKYWVIFIADRCREVVRECSWSGGQDKYLRATSTKFIERFSENILEEVIGGPSLGDLDYKLCVARKIPEWWELIHSELLDCKRSLEENLILIRRILDN